MKSGLSQSQPLAANLADLQQRCPQPVDVDAFYADMAAMQIELGPSFRWVVEAWRSKDGGAVEALARLKRPAAVRSLAGHALHPGLLDACFQAAGFTGAMGGATVIAFAIAALQLHQPVRGETWWCHVERTGKDTCDIQLLNEQGEQVALLHDFQVRAASSAAVRREDIWR
jgi:acyl transferase domain-containing protein